MLSESAKKRLKRALEHHDTQLEIATYVVEKLLDLSKVDANDPVTAQAIRSSEDFQSIEQHKVKAVAYVLDCLGFREVKT